MTVYKMPGMGTYGSLWQARGYSGAGDVEHLINSLDGQPAIVCGSAEGVFQEFDFAYSKYPDAKVFAANDVGMYIPELDHWVSLHGDCMQYWKYLRKIHRQYEDKKHKVTWTHVYDEKDIADYHWQDLSPIHALSGFFAMQVAWIMGCSPIILVGCPADTTRNFYRLAARAEYGGEKTPGGKGLRAQIKNEMYRLPDFRASVRSTSGWTKEFFGGI